MQINENINASNFLSVGTNASEITKNSKTNDSNGSDFASFLKAPKQQQTSTDSVKASETKSTQKSSERKDYRDNTGVRRDNNDDVSRTEAANKNVKDTSAQGEAADDKIKVISGDQNAASEELSGDISKEDIEAVAEILGNMIQFVSDKLDIPVEQVVDTINEMGLKPENLITEGDVKNLFLELKSADVSDLLTDESLRAELQDFMNDMNQLLQGLPMPIEQAPEMIGRQGIDFDDIVRIIDMNVADAEDIVVDDNVSTDKSISYSVSDDAAEPLVIVNDERTPHETLNESDNTEFSSESQNDADKSLRSNERKSSDSIRTERKDFVDPILQGISDAVSQVEDVNAVAESNVRPTSIVEQIVEQVRVNMSQESTSMEMQLYPEHLGRIQIHVISKDGVMTARIAAETESAKQAIEAGLNNLKESLQNQNLKVDAIEVMVSTTGFAESDERQDQYQQQGTGNRGRRLSFSDMEDEISDEEDEAERMMAEGSSVSYRA